MEIWEKVGLIVYIFRSVYPTIWLNGKISLQLRKTKECSVNLLLLSLPLFLQIILLPLMHCWPIPSPGVSEAGRQGGASPPIDHFGTEHSGKSHFCTDVSWREHFGICTVRRCERSGRWTFQHGNVSTWERFDMGTFQHEEFLTRGIFGTGTFWHGDISAHGHIALQGAKISMCRNVPVPKYPCAEMFLCRKYPMLKCSRVETSICRNVRSTERCMGRNVPVMKYLCRNDSCQCVPFQNGL